MSTDNNNQDGTPTENEGGEQMAVVEKPSITNEELAALKQKAELAEKLEKEVGSLKRDLKKAQKQTEETPEKTNQHSDEPDYARLAFLNSQQVNHPDDQKVVLEEAERLKLPLTDVLQMEHIKARLQNNKDTRESQAGMPQGKGRTQGPTKGDVEYYLANPDKVPDDLELHNKVIEAKMKKIENDSKFASVPFIG